MKKILIGLTIIANTCFADWKTLDTKDDFGEKTGKTYVACFSDRAKICITIDKEKNIISMIAVNKKISTFMIDPSGIALASVSFKFDNGEVVKVDAYTDPERTGVAIGKVIYTNVEDLIDKISKSKSTMIFISTQDGSTVDTIDNIGIN